MIDIVIYTVSISSAILMALAITFSSRTYLSKWWLAGFLSLLSFEMLIGAFNAHNFKWPLWFVIVNRGLEWLYGPLMYMYLKSHSQKEFHIRRKDIKHFLPSILPMFLNHEPTLMITTIIYQSFYFALITSRLKTYLSLLPKKHQKNKRRWLRSTVILLGATFVISTCQHLIPSLPKTLSYIAVFPVFVILILFHFRFPAIFYSPVEFKGGLSENEHIKKLGLDVESLPSLTEDIRKYLENEEPHLDQELTLGSLASQLGLTEQQLSFLIKREFKTTFYDYLNKERIKKACHLLRTESKISITRVIEESGFKSKSTFYRAFRDEMGMTPREFNKSLNNQSHT